MAHCSERVGGPLQREGEMGVWSVAGNGEEGLCSSALRGRGGCEVHC